MSDPVVGSAAKLEHSEHRRAQYKRLAKENILCPGQTDLSYRYWLDSRRATREPGVTKLVVNLSYRYWLDSRRATREPGITKPEKSKDAPLKTAPDKKWLRQGRQKERLLRQIPNNIPIHLLETCDSYPIG